MKKEEWFADWFDTSYYHTLYRNRDEHEAARFLGNLTENLQLSQGAKLLDLACGKGRHSITLNQLGFTVLGADLSPNSISIASKSAKEGLTFTVQDMREPILGFQCDAVLNLFTSFGYFDDLSDNDKVIGSVRSMLKENGIFVIDFMNAERTIHNLVKEETKTVDGIDFQITRRYDGEHIFKDIRFHDNGQDFHFTERVQALTLDHFETLLKNNNFEILRTFGDFDLQLFDPQTSDRLIIVSQKR